MLDQDSWALTPGQGKCQCLFCDCSRRLFLVGFAHAATFGDANAEDKLKEAAANMPKYAGEYLQRGRSKDMQGGDRHERVGLSRSSGTPRVTRKVLKVSLGHPDKLVSRAAEPR